ncbi:hypothetical protein [Thalassoglobus polymorphus]|uniref:hypothetical protein n=1 Tax=Thalassoglobus polymorphus TaxID=2527994 RepID=UPI0011A0B9F6|nr:hypothetical protein [Thalassoglobus polymorphus]
MATRTLLSKAELAAEPESLRRNTTWRINELLGFDGFVHLYFPQCRSGRGAWLLVPVLFQLISQSLRSQVDLWRDALSDIVASTFLSISLVQGGEMLGVRDR